MSVERTIYLSLVLGVSHDRVRSDHYGKTVSVVSFSLPPISSSARLDESSSVSLLAVLMLSHGIRALPNILRAAVATQTYRVCVV